MNGEVRVARLPCRYVKNRFGFRMATSKSDSLSRLWGDSLFSRSFIKCGSVTPHLDSVGFQQKYAARVAP